MNKILKLKAANGIYWVEIKDADLRIVCGCPEDTVKHLMRNGLIRSSENNGMLIESGPNVILLSDVLIQNGCFSNLAEFPVLQMLYRQGMIIPNHPNNTGVKPLLLGSKEQINAQLNYIYVGNYGITDIQDLIAAGIDEAVAKERMRLKLRFAFGKIKKTDELLAVHTVTGQETEIRNGVMISRIRLNVFKISYKDEQILVDLNLKENEKYECPYSVGFQNIEREYFAVIHSGEGDGWNINKPSMSAIIMFQSKIYLIDAGPNILYTLNGLGININEVDGIFHTHCHDDHFCGLPVLMRADHKIKYYAAKSVYHSVAKKLSSLLSVECSELVNYFDFIELNENEWNNIHGLEVKPIPAPHPVENTIIIFRAFSNSGYKTYGHFADLTDLSVLKKMIVDDSSKSGISEYEFEEVKKNYLAPLTLKKIDVGGGMIHGNANDFKNDNSEKILLAHISNELSIEQKQIGSGAPFGMVDKLILSYHEFNRSQAYFHLKSYFPSASHNQLVSFVNNEIIVINPETIIIKKNETIKFVYLVLTGNIEMLCIELGIHNMLSAGAILGDFSGFTELISESAYRAKSFVQLLKIPVNAFQNFVNINNLSEQLKRFYNYKSALNRTNIFGDGLSSKVQNAITQTIEEIKCSTGLFEPPISKIGIFLVTKGKVQLNLENDCLETLEFGGFWGATRVLYSAPELFKVNIIEPAEFYFIPKNSIIDIPIIHWKLREIYDRRMKMITNPDLVSRSVFSWIKEYSIGIPEIDEQHKKLLSFAENLYQNIILNKNNYVISKSIDFLIDYTDTHFKSEEKMMLESGYQDYNQHIEIHNSLLNDVKKYVGQLDNDTPIIIDEFQKFLKNWIIEHILTTDRKFGAFITAE